MFSTFGGLNGAAQIVSVHGFVPVMPMPMPTPEPASFAAMARGVAGLIRCRKKAQPSFPHFCFPRRR